MASRYKYVKGKKYWLYETYNTWGSALKVAKNKRKRNGCRYFIEIIGDEILFPEKEYKLYLDKCVKLF